MNETGSFLSTPAILMIVSLAIYMVTVRQVTVFSFVLLGMLFLEFTHLGIEYFMFGWFENTTNFELVVFCWYWSFAVTDWLFAYLIFVNQQDPDNPKDTISALIAWVFVLMGLIQVFRYVDRAIIETNVFGLFYQQSILVLNATLAVLVAINVGLAIVGKFRKQDRLTL